MDGEGDNSGGLYEGGPQTGYDTDRPARSLYETAREVILRPRDFFRGLSPDYERGPDHPVWFAVIVGTLTAPLLLVTEALDPVAMAQEGASFLDVLQSVAQSAATLTTGAGWALHNATHGRAIAVALIQALFGLGSASSALWS